ncbi:MAG: hypothetical protein K1Y36_10560 [Blastocatellia bacterium]|nr:hypothetical protein [Blastocatellia bacterium]
MTTNIHLLFLRLGGNSWQAPLPPDLGDLVPLVLLPCFCLTVGWLVWLLTRTRHLETQARIEVQRRLVDKLHSTEDVLRLLQTTEGRELLASFSLEQLTRQEVLGMVRKGIVLTAVGGGGVYLRQVFPVGYGLPIFAAILTGAIGIGLLLAALVTSGLTGTQRPLSSRTQSHNKNKAEENHTSRLQ